MPRACIRKLVFAVPHHSAAWRIAFSAMPVTSAVFRGVHSLTVLGHLLEADRVVADEVVIEPVVLDHQVQDAGEQGGVAARLDRQEQVAGAGERA